ncbi:MAG: Hpt domain-containing protein [Clostridiales bacterium]|nr:Hpt domain-containing protein [Clostridiales bacterium]
MTMQNKYMPNHFFAAPGEFGPAGQEDYSSLKPALDVADGMGRVMNNKKLYCRLLRTFSGPKMAEDISLAVESGDHIKVQQAAHALKGVSANLGISELMNISLQIETRAKASEAAGDLLPALEQAVAAATGAIERLLASEEA